MRRRKTGGRRSRCAVGASCNRAGRGMYECKSSEQGRRPTHEDTDVIKRLGEVTLAGVFDGHAGKEVAEELRARLPMHLLSWLQDMDFQETDKVVARIRSAFLAMDRWLRYSSPITRVGPDGAPKAGSTAIVVVKSGRHVYLANVGDSRAIVFTNKGEILLVTVDHKPNDPDEKKRIEAAGGTVERKTPTSVYRVNRRLALSRAFGDFQLKLDRNGKYSGTDGPVSAEPTIFHVELASPQPRDTRIYAVVACDGLFDVFGNEEVVRKTLAFLATPEQGAACQRLTAAAIAAGSTDNVSALLVELTSDK